MSAIIAREFTLVSSPKTTGELIQGIVSNNLFTLCGQIVDLHQAEIARSPSYGMRPARYLTC